MTLQQGQAHPRGHGELLSLVESLAALLAVLHASGRVHRDLKPVRPHVVCTCACAPLQFRCNATYYYISTLPCRLFGKLFFSPRAAAVHM